LFFAAVLVTSLVAGVGPSLVVLSLGLPVAAFKFAIPNGATVHQATFQALLYSVDGLIIIYLTHVTQRARRRLQATNRDLNEAAGSLRRSEARTREIVDLSPDAYFQADIEGRFVDVNEAACRLLGYTRDELLGKMIVDLIPRASAEATEVARTQILRPGLVREWLFVRNDGTAAPVEVSSNTLPDGHWQAFVRDVGDRKRGEEAVRKSETKFRRLVETMPDGVFINQGGRIVYANHGFAVLLGYDDENPLLGRPFEDFVAPEALDLVKARIRLVLDRGEIAPPLEVRLRRRDGSPAIIESVAIGAEYEGAPAIIVVIRDLAPRVRAEQALRFSEAKFSGIVSISADAIISIDEQQKITVFNVGAEKIFGYSRDEVLGSPIDLLIPERLRRRHRQDVAGFAAGQGTTRRMGQAVSSIVGRRKSGEEFPAEASISNLKVGDTRLLTVVLRDVTERARLEKQQRMLAEVGVVLAATLDYERTLATVAEIAVRDFADWCMVELMDAGNDLRHLKVVSAEPAKAGVADRLEQIEFDRARAYLTRSVVESRQPMMFSCFAEQLIERFAQDSEQLEILRAVAPSSVISVPLMHRDQLLGTLTFISSSPSRLFNSWDLQLAKAIAERASLAIENARLYRAALQATGVRDQVLGVVAHDLRNPLSTISLHAAALKRADGEPERRNQHQREAIERAARRMDRLIQDLLDVVVLEAGRLRLERTALSPGELIGEAADMQQALAASSSINLRVDVASDVPIILGDRDRLLQVFENLIGNALKFTEAGGQVTVGAARGPSEAVFWVADTGRGMTAVELAQVFDRFWQASARSGRLGAGLGLPITKGIVEAHDGRIWAESAPGRGSTFVFSIPLAPHLAELADSVIH
jgi:PAS domain S-box-containing protein